MALIVTLLVLASAFASVAGDESATVANDAGGLFTLLVDTAFQTAALSFQAATPKAFAGWWEAATGTAIEVWYRDGSGDHKLFDFTPPAGDQTSWTVLGTAVGPFVSIGSLIVPDEQLHLTYVDVTGGGNVFQNHNFPAAGWSFVPTGCVTQCGDPHFRGLDGVKYEFQGKHDKTFAVISEPTVELNSLFVSAGQHKSYVTAVCLRACNDTLVIKSPSTVLVNGKGLAIGGQALATSFAVQRPHKHRIEVVVPQKWSLSFNVDAHVDIDDALPLHEYNGKTHGVLGHTMKHRDPSGKSKCNARNEGGCEVEGVPEDYIVHGDDLCGTAWKYTQFDADMCV